MSPPINPPTHQTIHPPMGGEVSTDFKSSNRFETSRLVQVLLNFDWFWGPPQGLRGWVDWGGGGKRVPPTHVHTHMHTHACMTSLGIPRDSPNGGCHLHEIIMFTMYACACAHVCGAPPTTPHPIHPPPLTAAGSPKHQNSTSLEQIEIIRLFEDSLPLNIPELI